jgi:glycerol-3-phosphate acyltransferase PlsY
MLAVFCGLSSMAGHMWPVWLGFKGGKGVATSAGIVFAMNWMAALAAMGVWIIVFAAARYVSLASVVAAVSLPVAQHFTGHHFWKRHDFPWIATVFFAVAALLVIVRHRSNLQRLRLGTEPRFSTRRA